MKRVILFLILFTQISFAENPKLCQEKLKQELMNVIQNDKKDFLEKIYLKSALKLAKRILDNKKSANNKHLNNSIEAYLGSFDIGVNSTKAIEDTIKDLHQKYGESNVDISKDEYLKKIDTLSSGNSQLTNQEISVMIGFMDKLNINKELDKTDEAMTWYAQEVGDKYSMSNFINNFFKQNKTLSLDQVNKELATASNNLQYEFSKVKQNTFKKYADLCIKNYNSDDQDNTSSNASVFFKACTGDLTDEILGKELFDLFAELKEEINPVPYKVEGPVALNNDQIRKLQDSINNLDSELDKVVSYYGSSLNESDCENFSVIDKKSNKLMLYNKKGQKQMSFDLVLGKDQTGFNSDSTTRWIENAGKTVPTQTTGAGIYTFDEDKQYNPKEYYKTTYANQLYSLKESDGEESVMALHAVPLERAVGDYQTRMNMFKNGGGKQSGGCLNIESYNFHIVKNHIKPECPLVVLPAESPNYYFVKDGKLNFSSISGSKKSGTEKVQYKGKEYQNKYNFTPNNKITKDIKSIGLGGYTSDQATSVYSYVNSHMEEIKKPYLEKDSLQDIIMLSIATASKTNDDPEKIVNDFINAYENIKRNSKLQDASALGYNYDLLSRKDKLKKILEKYNKNTSYNLDPESITDSALSNISFSY